MLTATLTRVKQRTHCSVTVSTIKHSIDSELMFVSLTVYMCEDTVSTEVASNVMKHEDLVERLSMKSDSY